MVLHQFQLSYLRQQRDYTNKRKTYVVLLQLDEDFFYVSPISGRGSNPSSPQLSGGAVGLKTIVLHLNDDVSDSVACDYNVDPIPLEGVANILLLKTSDRGGELGLPGKWKDVRSRS